MAINLVKGQTIDLRKNDKGESFDLASVTIGLGWDVRQKSTGFLGKLFGGGKEEEYLSILKKNKKDCERNFEGTVFNHYPRPMLIDCGEYNKELLFDNAKEVLKKLK